MLSLGWSADGETVTIGRSGGELCLLEPRSLTEMGSSASTAEPVRALAMSPDGGTVAFSQGEGIIALCDTRSAELRPPLVDHELREQVGRFVEAGHLRVDQGRLVSQLGRVLSIAWSSDGTTLAAGTGAGVRLWDLAARNVGRVLRADKPGVSALAWQPLGTLLAMGVGRGEVWLWEARTGAEVPVPVGQRQTVQSLAWSADGRALASADEAGTVVFWDVEALEALVRSADDRPQSDGVISLALSSDGTRMVSGGSSNTLHAWDALGRQVSVVEELPGPVIGLTAFDGGFLFSPFLTDWTDVVLWDRLDQRPRGVFRGETGASGCALAPSPDSRLIACGDLMGSVWIRELRTADCCGFTGCRTRTEPKGRHLAPTRRSQSPGRLIRPLWAVWPSAMRPFGAWGLRSPSLSSAWRSRLVPRTTVLQRLLAVWKCILVWAGAISPGRPMAASLQ